MEAIIHHTLVRCKHNLRLYVKPFNDVSREYCRTTEWFSVETNDVLQILAQLDTKIERIQ